MGANRSGHHCKENKRRGHSIWYASAVSLDYVTVGHVTVDVLADGSRRPGGSAFYSALQAARLGCRTLILTRGVRAEIELLLEPFLGELALEVIEAPRTTTLETLGAGVAREQRLLAWAGEIAAADVDVEAAIVHFAPIARETPAGLRGSAGFVGVTPQGLVREWPRGGGRVVACTLDRSLLPERRDALVLSASERESCAALLRPGADAGARGGDAIIAVTAGAGPTELHLRDGALVEAAVPRVARMRDDLGAGDVFAAAFFVALADGAAPIEAASFANAAAAVRIAGEGPRAIGARTSIERRMALAA
jgi:1D-myo-inositol 3-kinase